ncbi:hypothetical protein, partial [Staphylococcus aureus]
AASDFLMIRRPPRSTRKESSAASDVYKRQIKTRKEQLPQWGQRPCLLYTSPSPRDTERSRMPASA